MHKKDVNSTSKKRLTTTMEDYLEAMYNLSKEKKAVRVKDIAKKLGVKCLLLPACLKP